MCGAATGHSKGCGPEKTRAIAGPARRGTPLYDSVNNEQILPANGAALYPEHPGVNEGTR